MKDKEMLETIRFEDKNYVLIGIFEIKREKRKPVYALRGGTIPLVFKNQSQEQYIEHYGANSELEILKRNFNISGISSKVIYDDNSMLQNYEGVYILEEDFLNNKKALKKLKVKYVDKTMGVINNDSQFYTTLFCILGIVVIVVLIWLLN